MEKVNLANKEKKMKINTLPASFFFDKIGVIVKIEMNADHVFRGELVYDGRNQIIFNRNDKMFYLLTKIAPIIRKRIMKSKYVTIAEEFNDEITQAYDISVRIVDNIPGEDTYDVEMQEYIERLEERLGKDKVEEMKREAIHTFSQLSA